MEYMQGTLNHTNWKDVKVLPYGKWTNDPISVSLAEHTKRLVEANKLLRASKTTDDFAALREFGYEYHIY